MKHVDDIIKAYEYMNLKEKIIEILYDGGMDSEVHRKTAAYRILFLLEDTPTRALYCDKCNKRVSSNTEHICGIETPNKEDNPKETLEELNSKIQVCPNCGKIDVYKDDNHTCDRDYHNYGSERYEN